MKITTIYYTRECPNCTPDLLSRVFGNNFNYCPICGAKMVEAVKEETYEEDYLFGELMERRKR